MWFAVTAILCVSCAFVAVGQKFPKDANGDTIYPDAMYMQDSHGQLRLENLTENVDEMMNILPTEVKEEDIILVLYTRYNMHNATKLGVNDLDGLRRSTFNHNKKSLFVIHGWINDCDAESVVVIRRAAIAAADMNVFCVDWSKHADGLYALSAKHSIPEVGRFLSVFLNRIMAEAYVRPQDITIVGHSLGAHVAGRAGSLMNKKCNIVGLDPAGPLFKFLNLDGRISQDDGKYVQILHTNAGYLGFDGNMGHADYYANCGTNQPGCIKHILPPAIMSCSHERAPILYAESLSGGHFKATSCNGTCLDYIRGKCAGAPTSYMGGLILDENARGTYYFKTYDEYPFAMD